MLHILILTILHHINFTSRVGYYFS